jgi:predicted acylesterase/phospholipase RssA
MSPPPTLDTKQTIAHDALVDLALQGGGAHGAFTWGVLDRSLKEKGHASTAFPALLWEP